MDKKIGILFSILVLLTLGVFYAVANITSVSLTEVATSGKIFDDSEVVNVTVTADNSGGGVTNVTFTIPSEIAWMYGAQDGNLEFPLNENWTFTNVTYAADGSAWTTWNCTNTSSIEINCYTEDNTDNLSATYNNKGSLILMLNMSAAANVETSTANLSVLNVGGETVETTLTNVDSLPPRLIDLNVTDGSTTIINGSMDASLLLSANHAWTVTAAVEDLNLDTSLVLGYSCDGSSTDFLEADDNISADSSLQGSGSVKIAEWTISTSCFDSSNDLKVTFSIAANDTKGGETHSIALNESGALPFAINATPTNVPRVVKVNITQTKSLSNDPSTIRKTHDSSASGGLDGTSDYLGPITSTINIEVSGAQKQDSVWVVWNETGAGTTVLKPRYGTSWIVKNLDNNFNLNASTVTPDSTSTATVVYSASLPLAGNSSNDFVFWVYINNTGNNYTAVGGPYRFTVDSTAPTLTMTAPTDRTISPRGSITYTCTASDSESGNYKMKWILQKPDGTTVTKNYEAFDSGSSDKYTFTGDDTNKGGTYTVKCTVSDAVGNERTVTSTSTQTFSVHYSTAYDESSGGSSGSSSVAKVDLSTPENTEATIKEKQGTITTFTLDGTTVHKITIKEVTEDAVTLVIESEPIEVTLKIGETKEVDVDGDGVNDISLTLNGIEDGVAYITTVKLSAPKEEESETPEEETPTTPSSSETTTPTVPTEEPSSNRWLWILIIVIIVVVGVGYWFIKKK